MDNPYFSKNQLLNSMEIDLNKSDELYIDGDRFNTFNANSLSAGPLSSKNVPNPDPTKNLHYNLNQIITKAQGSLITSSGIMAFHCIGDTGNDSSHNGGPNMRLAVAEMMEAQLNSGIGNPETPCFCYHVGDVIYPGSDENLYESEFYVPYSGYGNAIVVIPGNHDSYVPGGLKVFADNFMQPKLVLVKGQRPAMNMPWYYWVLDTPVATIIGLAAIANSISVEQQNWFNKEMKNADTNKALIVAVHYPPYCFDGSDNFLIRNCITSGIAFSGRKPDLLLSGHSHNYQRIQTPNQYTMIVNGAGGVGVGGIRSYAKGNQGNLIYGNDSDYGALTIIVNNIKKTIQGNYYGAISNTDKVGTKLLDSFTINY